MNQKEKPKEKQEAFRAPKGMHDVLPVDEPYWEKIESAARALARSYGFSRLEPPILETAALYNKTSGEGSDVVEKEMYSLRTKGGDLFALRPEYTPGICRASIEHGMSRLPQPQKLFYFGPVFRHDRPQLGRYRQFTQIGFEVIGGQNDPIYDAEIITIVSNLLGELKIKKPTLKINSIGCRVCRPNYKRQLQAYYKNYEKELCEDCVRRLATNPLKLLDCKQPQCQPFKEKAPNFLDKLCVACKTHFRTVLEYLEEVGIVYDVDPRLVRGLDYYNRTVFEFFADGKEAEIGALGGGGRYDYLMETIGGHATPALGAAPGVERIISVMRAKEIVVPPRTVKKVFLAHAGSLAKKNAFVLREKLLASGVGVAEALSKESLGAQLKVADKEGLTLALILGQKEIYEKSVIVRDLAAGTQESVLIEKVVDDIKKRLKA
jgi:histidyl-tRNA synthetase